MFKYWTRSVAPPKSNKVIYKLKTANTYPSPTIEYIQNSTHMAETMKCFYDQL